MNLNNYGICTGRVCQAPAFFTNRDGSRRCRFSIAASNSYKASDGTRHAQFVPIEAFIPADVKSTVYDILSKGMLVTVAYEVRNNNWQSKEGEQYYDIILQADSVRIQESKTATEARKAAKKSNTGFELK